MAVAGPLRGFPYGPPPPSACFGPHRPCSRRGRAVLGFSGYALPPSRFGRLRHCPTPDPAAAGPPHCAPQRPPAEGPTHCERNAPRGRRRWTAGDRTARYDRPTADRPDRPTRPTRTKAARGTSEPVPRSLLARCSLDARSLRAARAAARSAAGAPKGRRGAKPRTPPRRSWAAWGGYKKTHLGTWR